MKYLFRSKYKIYYLRFRLPTILRQMLDRHEIKISLRTKNSKLAKSRATKFIFHTQQLKQISKIIINSESKKQLSVNLINQIFHEYRLIAEVSSNCSNEYHGLLIRGLNLKEDYQLNTNLIVKDNSPLVNNSERLVDIIEIYRTEMLQTSSWSNKTETENIRILQLMLELIPVEHIDLVTKEHARMVKQSLFKLPKNRTKNTAFKQLNVQQLIKLKIPKSNCMKISTIQKHLTRFSSFWKWCKFQGYSKDNIFDGLNVKDNRKQKHKRTPFSSEQLKIIFTHSFFTNQSRPLHAYYYWLPLLGLYQGARIAELCGLMKQDIQLIDNIWCMEIKENKFRTNLKNEYSERTIPIHSFLIKMGFIEYVKSRPNNLILDVTSSSKGVADNASKWFGRFKNSLNFDRLVVFHSFRHNFINYFTKRGMLDTRLKVLVGHTDESITFQTYSQGTITMSILKDYLEQLAVIETINVVKYAIIKSLKE